jgi:hypothetical protein
LADFSGDSAVEERDDGPLCVLSSVDTHTCKRLLSQGLAHAPDHPDRLACLRRFRLALQLRGLALRGVTTEGSPLYPGPLRTMVGEVPHQIGEFPSLKELTKASLRAVAQARQTLAARQPPLTRGRPSTSAAKRVVRHRAQTQQTSGALFAQRSLFVQHDLTPAARRTLPHRPRGLPQLRTLRAIMAEGYRSFARRCRTDTALAKRATLRQRVRRDKHLGTLLTKLRSPALGEGVDVS